MKWLGSLDELLYEVMSWLLFFPLTLWRAAIRPIAAMSEVGIQAALPEKERYGAVLSPPLFLALALLLAHATATALGQTDAIIANRHGLASLVDDNASALVLRTVVFAAFPLFLAARLVRRRGWRLDRATLRQPFYEQCYPTAVFALGMSIGTSVMLVSGSAGPAGATIMLITLTNFIAVEISWFRRQLGCGVFAAMRSVAVGMVEGATFLLAIGFLFTR